MLDSPQLWCVVGANGSGKSFICDSLAEEGDFECVKRDALMEDLWDEFGGFESFSRTLKTGKKGPKKRLLRKLRGKIRQLVEAFSWEGYRDNPTLTSFSDQVAACLSYSDDKLAQFYTLSDGLLYHLICHLAQQKGLRRSSKKAQKREARVLLDDPSLLSENQFYAARSFLSSEGINAGLLVIRTTRERVIHSAQERYASGATQGLWSGRAAAGLNQLNETTSFRDTERVIVYDNVHTLEEAVHEIRTRIVEEDLSNVDWPLRLVLS